MRAKKLSDILKASDRVVVSNITGREASKVTTASQEYCGNIVGGWALGKGGQSIQVSDGESVPVFSTVEDLAKHLPKNKQPNKVIVYSPPPAVYGDVKEVVEHLGKTVETIFVITEHVSIEVTAKIAQICSQAKIDVLGCNTLGVINTLEGVRVGAVGGTDPADSFKKGTAAIISNSGNMVNTMASYLISAGIGTSYGISTGKDLLILTPIKELLGLARDDKDTQLLIAYIEPGGLYEKEAIEMMKKKKYPKPIIAYITGELLRKGDLSLGHAGAVVEGKGTSAKDKMQLFDEYFGIEPFEPDKKYNKSPALTKALKKGIRITSLHHLPAAAALIYDTLGIERDFRPSKPLQLNPWFMNYEGAEKKLPKKLILGKGTIPEPYGSQVNLMLKETFGATPPKRNMKNTSYMSANDGKTTRIYGYRLDNQMKEGSFVKSLFLAWTGEKPRDFEAKLLEQCFIAALTNGPGTISAQGAKLSSSAGNAPNTAMIATLACIGSVHGGNGQRAVEYLIRVFKDVNLTDPWYKNHGLDLEKIVDKAANDFAEQRTTAKEAGVSYERIPCLGHPVFKNDPVNYDPRERAMAKYMKEKKLYNIFLEFYRLLTHKIKDLGIARNVWAVNVDGAIASTVLATCWQALKEKRISMTRVCDIAFMVFAVGRTAGAGGEYLDHQDHGSPMDMRTPASEGVALTKAKD